MALPSQDTLYAGSKITAAWANSDVRDAVNSLLTGWACSLSNSAAISVATGGTGQLLTWDTEAYDTDTMHSTSSNTSRIVATTAGLYAINYTIAISSDPGGVRQIYGRMDAGGSPTGGTAISTLTTQIGAASGGSTYVVGYGEVRMAATHYLELWAIQTSGNTLTINAGSRVTARLIAS